MSLHNCEEATGKLACEVYVCTWHRSGMVVASQMMNSYRRGPALQSEALTAGAPVASPPCATSAVTGPEGTLICSLGLYAGRPSSPVSVPLCTPSAAFGPLSCCDAAPGRSLGSNSPSSQQHLHWQHVSQQVQFMPHCAERGKGCRLAFFHRSPIPCPTGSLVLKYCWKAPTMAKQQPPPSPLPYSAMLVSVRGGRRLLQGEVVVRERENDAAVICAMGHRGAVEAVLLLD